MSGEKGGDSFCSIQKPHFSPPQHVSFERRFSNFSVGLKGNPGAWFGAGLPSGGTSAALDICWSRDPRSPPGLGSRPSGQELVLDPLRGPTSISCIPCIGNNAITGADPPGRAAAHLLASNPSSGPRAEIDNAGLQVSYYPKVRFTSV